MARKGIAAVGIAALPIVCCAGLPLLLAAGLSVGALAAVGGAGAALIGLAVVAVTLGARRHRAATPCYVPLRRDREES